MSPLLAVWSQSYGSKVCGHAAHNALILTQLVALEWLAAGTIAVLVLDPPKRTATVYRGGGDAHVYGDQDTLDLSDAVGGRAFNFTVPVADLFT